MLEYLFIAETTNGLIRQDQDDAPKTQSHGSTFTDVLKEKVKKFSLVGKGHVFTVDLQDGHFEVDGLPFFMHTDFLLKDFRIVFYRQHTHDFTMDGKEVNHRIAYCFGWQTNDKDKKNVQRIMTIQ